LKILLNELPIRSINDFNRRYFPKQFAKEEREREIEEKGFGVVLANEIIDIIKNELRNIK
jgi:hypothetical protein